MVPAGAWPDRDACPGSAAAARRAEAQAARSKSAPLSVTSGASAPATPLDLSLVVRPSGDARVIDITATVGKRAGFPAAQFSDRDVKARISLPSGLERVSGSLSWTGDLAGDQVARFSARVRAARDTDGFVEASVVATGQGGNIDADSKRFHVSARGGRLRVSLDAPANREGPPGPPRPGAASPPR